MIRFSRVMRYALVFCVLTVVAATALAGCSGSSATDETTAAPETTVSSTPSGSASTTTTLPMAVSALDKELAKTANIQRDLSSYLKEQQATEDDPRLGIIYVLRARSQAITGRQALTRADLPLADAAMKDIYYMLNLGKAVATGNPAVILADAYAVVERLGIPSEAPEKAAELLDEFISKTAPMLDEATAITPTTTAS